MAKNNATLTTTVLAKDEASPTLRKVVGSVRDLDAEVKKAGTGMKAANDNAELFGVNIKSMPEKVSRMGSSLQLVTTAAGGMGAGLGEAAGKATYLASVIGTGGPLGIAIAALTAAMGAAAAIYRVYSEQADLVRGSITRLAGVSEALNATQLEHDKIISGLIDQIRFYGMASRDVAIIKAEEALALKANLPILQAELDLDRQRLATRRKEIEAMEVGSKWMGFIAAIRVAEKNAKIDEYNNDVANLELRQKAIEVSTQNAEKIREQIALLKDLKVADDQATDSRRLRTAAQRDETAWLNEQRDGIKQWEEEEQRYYDKRHRQQGDQLGMMAESFGSQADYYNQLADLQEGEAKRIESTSLAYVKQGEVFIGIAERSIAAYISGQRTGSEAAKMFARDTATMVIKAAAGKAMAEAMAAYSGIPFVGFALGISAAATLSTLILSYLTKFHSGGIVGFNDGARLPGMANDERAITVKVGERVQTAQQAIGGGSTVINVTNRGTFAPTSADTKRQAIQIGKVLARQRRLGFAT